MTSPGPIDNTEAELDAFEGVCRRLAGFEHHLNAEWVDGWLTAVAAGPRRIAIDEWLPALGGEAFDRAFADPDDVHAARQALEARMRVIARQLDAEALFDRPDDLRLAPLLLQWEGDEPPPTGAVWAEGFAAALEAWTADLQPGPAIDEEARALFAELQAQVAVLRLADDDPRLREMALQARRDGLATREDLVDEACLAVQDLRVWWVDHAPRPAVRRVEKTPGRNDPCPCGSGRKFKKCHGLAS